MMSFQTISLLTGKRNKNDSATLNESTVDDKVSDIKNGEVIEAPMTSSKFVFHVIALCGCHC